MCCDISCLWYYIADVMCGKPVRRQNFLKSQWAVTEYGA